MASASREELMRRLAEEVQSCHFCGLCDERTRPVVGEGDPHARIFFVGEAPGRREDETGRPFVGAAGQLLNRLLGRIGLRREDVYIGNVLKCRPPNNRRPTREEIEACSIHLEKQLDIIGPRIVAPMGNTAIEHIFRRFDLTPRGIGEVHGKLFEANAPWGPIHILQLYHPAAALYVNGLEEIMEADFEALGGVLGRIDG